MSGDKEFAQRAFVTAMDRQKKALVLNMMISGKYSLEEIAAQRDLSLEETEAIAEEFRQNGCREEDTRSSISDILFNMGYEIEAEINRLFSGDPGIDLYKNGVIDETEVSAAAEKIASLLISKGVFFARDKDILLARVCGEIRALAEKDLT